MRRLLASLGPLCALVVACHADDAPNLTVLPLEPPVGAPREPGPDAPPPAAGHVFVPMRDGVTLDTNVLLPNDGRANGPAILIRTPYPPSGAEATFGPFTARGFVVVVQSCRGTGASHGVLDPLVQEFPDGQDAVRWISKQPWSNGRVGTIGASYEGFTAIAAAIGTPEVSVVIADGAISDAFTGWPLQRGIPMDTGLLWWLEIVRTGHDLLEDPTYRTNVTNARPLLDLDVRAYGKTDAVWRRFAAETDHRSAFWQARSLVGRMSELCAPALHFQAANEWADDPLAAFQSAIASPCSDEALRAQRFVLGPHPHAGAVYDPFADDPQGSLLRAYLDHYLLGEPAPALAAVPRVQYHVSGAGSWRSASTWPPSAARREWFLDAAQSSLGASAPPGAANAALELDPTADACAAAAAIPQLTYESAPLDDGFDVAGAPELVATVSTSTEDADLSGILYERSPDGAFVWATTQRLRLRFRDGYVEPKAMSPGVPTEVRLKWNSTAHRLAKGNTLGVVLTTTECGLPENPGTLASVMSRTSARASTTTIHTGPAAPSRLVLPVAP